MTYQLGVDLGTTYTAAAVARDGVATMMTLGGREDAAPSIVLIREDGTTLVGDAAEYRGLSEPERMAREFKRRIGDTTPILIGGSPYSAESLTAKLLRWVVDEVASREGGTAREVVVTHPANWGPYKIELLGQAVQLAEIDEVRFITEPEAAAIYYASQQRVEPGETVAVYDLGGGTFDSAVLRKTESGFNVLGQPKGIERLGGIDFDAAVFAHVAGALAGGIEELDERDPAATSAVGRLRAECVAAKEALSADTDVSIPVLLPEMRTEVRLTRIEFESMIRPPLLETIKALRRTIDSADIELTDVTRVLLVGGSSRIPLVAQMISAELARPVAVDTHPKTTIARGAAIHSLAAAGDPTSVAPPPIAPPPVAPPPVAPPAAPPLGAPSADGTPASIPPSEPPEPPVPVPGGSRPDEPDGRSSRAWWKIAVPILAVVAIVGATIGFLAGGTETAAASEVLLEPLTSVGIDPFTPTADTDPDPEPPEVAAIIEAVLVEAATAPEAEVPVLVGTDPGLYGGTKDNARCDASAIIAFLEENPDKAEAWAGVQGIGVDELASYIGGLTPAVLQVDTQVTNHGFRNGQANPLQSVLQAGTSVLVDDTGVPRARCACGNPLVEPASPAAEVAYTGDQWDGFEESEVVAVEAGDPIDELVLTDTATGENFARPVGSSGEEDAPTEVATEIITTEGAGGEGDSTDEPEPEPEPPVDDRFLLDSGPITVSWSDDLLGFVANPNGEEYSVLMEGTFEVSLTFETGGGAASGTITGSMTGVSIGAENTYSASFTGTFSGTHDAEQNRLEGTVSWSGSATPGVESALPTDTTWDGAILLPPQACAATNISPCVFGATGPEIQFYWEMPIDIANVNPERLRDE